MKRFHLFSLLLGLLLSISAAMPVQAAGGNAISEARNGVVRILAVHGDGSMALGSGFAVGEAGKPSAVFVTNQHVTAGAEMIYILLDDKWYTEEDGQTVMDKEYMVECDVVYESNGTPDYAILRAERVVKERTALPLMPASLASAGESVYALGYPGISDYVTGNPAASIEAVTVTTGTISRLGYFEDKATEVIQMDAEITHGNSGGPLITAEGYVIGVDTYGVREDQDELYLAVQIDYVISRLNDLADIGTLYDFTFTLILDREEDGGMMPILLICVGVVAAAGAAAFLILGRGRGGERQRTAGDGKTRDKKAMKTVREEKEFPQTRNADEIGQTVPADSFPELRLVGTEGYFAGRRFALRGTIRMGRLPEKNDLVFPPDTTGVSGVHCVVKLDAKGAVLTDLGSSFGTFVNNAARIAPNQPVRLEVGDSFALGSQKQKFRLESKGGEAT